MKWGIAALAVSALACAADGPTLGETELVVSGSGPSPGLPAEAMPAAANNNLDVVRHEGRVYLAFRTAATHFAGTDPRLVVVSSTDEKSWSFETTIALGRDVREPRFLSLGGRLFLYFAILGTEVTTFDPQGFQVTERTAAGWTTPADVYEPGFIPWRARVVGGAGWLAAYVGGENLYNGNDDPVEVHLLATDDGRSFRPAVAGAKVVQVGGGSETDFLVLGDGSLVAVVRNEHGDASGFGSKICRAEPGALGTWRCVHDPRKLDSPLLFEKNGAVWLVARRQLANDGNYDLGRRELGLIEQSTHYQTAYSTTPKRCSLWRVDPRALAVSHVLDLPSRGDTCFAGVLDVPGHDDQVAIYDYSSDIDGPDLAWLAAQFRPTYIYRTIIRF